MGKNINVMDHTPISSISATEKLHPAPAVEKLDFRIEDDRKRLFILSWILRPYIDGVPLERPGFDHRQGYQLSLDKRTGLCLKSALINLTGVQK